MNEKYNNGKDKISNQCMKGDKFYKKKSNDLQL